MATNNAIDIGVVPGGGFTYTFPSGTSTLATLALTETLTNKTFTTPVINGVSTGTGVATTGTASTLALRDTNGNLTAVNHIEGYTTTSTAAGTTTLTVGSTRQQFFTGSTTQTITLPVVSTLVLGQQFEIVNLSTGLVTINSSGSNAVLVLASLTSVVLTVVLITGTTAASWDSSRYLSILTTSGKSVFVKNTLTLQGTDATTMTFPGTSATIARTDAAQTFTGTQTFTTIATTNITSTSNIVSNNAITASANAATIPITSTVNTVTNNSAAGITITLTTGAANRQFTEVLILDSSAVAQAITWVNTENSTVTPPTTTNGSATLPVSVLFQYNSATTKWRCVASA